MTLVLSVILGSLSSRSRSCDQSTDVMMSSATGKKKLGVRRRKHETIKRPLYQSIKEINNDCYTENRTFPEATREKGMHHQQWSFIQYKQSLSNWWRLSMSYPETERQRLRDTFVLLFCSEVILPISRLMHIAEDDRGRKEKPQEWPSDGFIMLHREPQTHREKQFLENNQRNDRAPFSTPSDPRARHAHTQYLPAEESGELNGKGEWNSDPPPPRLWAPSHLAKQQSD